MLQQYLSPDWAEKIIIYVSSQYYWEINRVNFHAIRFLLRNNGQNLLQASPYLVVLKFIADKIRNLDFNLIWVNNVIALNDAQGRAKVCWRRGAKVAALNKLNLF